jgi:hypothetical protein
MKDRMFRSYPISHFLFSLPDTPTHISFLLIGPSFGSYNPPLFGKFRLSNKMGLSTFWTEIDRISSVVRNENDRDETSEDKGLPISILSTKACCL